MTHTGGGGLSILLGVCCRAWQENSKLSWITPPQGHQIWTFWNNLLHLLLINLQHHRTAWRNLGSGLDDAKSWGILDPFMLTRHE